MKQLSFPQNDCNQINYQISIWPSLDDKLSWSERQASASRGGEWSWQANSNEAKLDHENKKWSARFKIILGGKKNDSKPNELRHKQKNKANVSNVLGAGPKITLWNCLLRHHRCGCDPKTGFFWHGKTRSQLGFSFISSWCNKTLPAFILKVLLQQTCTNTTPRHQNRHSEPMKPRGKRYQTIKKC